MSKEEKNIEEKRVNNYVFLIGILGGILISIFVEALYMLTKDLPKEFFWVILVLSIIGLIYLWGWYRIINSINNFILYKFTFNKIHKDKRFDDIFDSFFKTLREKLEKNFKLEKIKKGIIEKTIMKVKYDYRIFIGGRFFPLAFIDFRENERKGNSHIYRIIISNSKNGDLIKQKILKTIKDEERKQKNIKNWSMIKKDELYYSLTNPYRLVSKKPKKKKDESTPTTY